MSVSSAHRHARSLYRLFHGRADVNHFHAAGGMGFLIRELLDAGLLHPDVPTVWGDGLEAYTVESALSPEGGVAWRQAAAEPRLLSAGRPR